MFSLPDFKALEDPELRRTIADLEFQRDVAQAFLDRAIAEQKDRKIDKKQGVFRAAVMPTADPDTRH